MKRLIAIAGTCALALVAVPAFIHHAGPPPFDWRWVAALAAFAAAFSGDLRRPDLWLLASSSREEVRITTGDSRVRSWARMLRSTSRPSMRGSFKSSRTSAETGLASLPAPCRNARMVPPARSRIGAPP